VKDSCLQGNWRLITVSRIIIHYIAVDSAAIN